MKCKIFTKFFCHKYVLPTCDVKWNIFWHANDVFKNLTNSLKWSVFQLWTELGIKLCSSFLIYIHIGYRIQILQLTRSLLKRLAWPGGRSMSAIHLPFFYLLPMGTFWTTYTPHRQKWALFGPHIHLIWFCLRRHWTTPMTHKCKSTKFWKSWKMCFLIDVTVNVICKGLNHNLNYKFLSTVKSRAVDNFWAFLGHY